ncbi:hypothetical protein L6452_37647 [Arctium lappa]|uniref:Uncharacterized protein n=1 Tax=Arctium lappa TaxID=4217 RepID=A0ACB8Y7Q7_ARCLA|nr:hypothetical protein L6452_37647 [Arctium lappa]
MRVAVVTVLLLGKDVLYFSPRANAYVAVFAGSVGTIDEKFIKNIKISDARLQEARLWQLDKKAGEGHQLLFGRLAGQLTLRPQQLAVNCETKTNDNDLVNIVAWIQYSALADSASDAFCRINNTRSRLQAYVFDVIGASISKLNIDDVEKANDIAKAVTKKLENTMSTNVFKIAQMLVVSIEPDEHVKRAMNEIAEVVRLGKTTTEKGKAEKILQIKRAKGGAESNYLYGLGIALQRQVVVDGLRDSVLGFLVNVQRTRVNDVVDVVLVTWYLKTIKESWIH